MKRRESQDDDESKRGRTTGLDEEEDGSATSDADSPPPRKGDLPGMKKASMAATSSCSTSTVATVPGTPTTTMASSNGPQNTTTLAKRDENGPLRSSSTDGIDRQRQSLMRQTLLLFLLSAVSFAIFLCIYLPTMALVALTIFAATTCLAFVGLYRRFLLEYENLLSGRGIGDYLPASLYEQLAETSLHEWMMDSTFFLEYRHLMLYYVPGITTEQLEAMVNRLSPHHQEMLRRHGLGQFFGDGFMRLLMGDSRWQPQHQAEQQLLLESQPNVDDTTMVIASRGLPADGAQTEETGENPPVRSITAAPVSRRLYMEDEPSDIGSTQEEANAEQEETSRDIEIEGQVLTDAIYEMFLTYSRSLLSASVQSLNQLAVQAVDYLSPWVIRFGVGVTTVSASVGLVGVWYGAYYPWRATHLTPRFPSGRTLLSAALFGGGTVGMMIVVRSGVRRAMQQPKVESEETKDTKDQKR